MAATVVEDSRSRFVLNDAVADASVYGCVDAKGAEIPGSRFMPENSFVDDDSDVPYRVYRIAVPAGASPRVSLSVSKTVSLGKPFCSGARLKASGVTASAPVLKDGLWMLDVKVPLYEKRGESVVLRKNFKLSVDFGKSGSGVNPGKRAVSRVSNPLGASHFGVSVSARKRSLRKAGVGEFDDVHFLARIGVGSNDKNIGTQGRDGLYALPFEAVRNSLLPLLQQDSLDGIRIDKLRLYGASPDTMTATVPGYDQIVPNHLFEVPIEIHDHSRRSSVADSIFGEGDTLFFVGYGTAFWKLSNGTYYHSNSPYSFYQYFQLGWKESGKGKRLNDRIRSSKGAAKDIEWYRYVRGEKDVNLIDSYYGKGQDWERSSGKEWFWFWHCRFDTTVVPSNELTVPQTRNLPGLIEGEPGFVDVNYYPYRSIYSDSAVYGSDQLVDISFSLKEYATRMADIRFKFGVNGSESSNFGSELYPGGNFRFATTALKPAANEFSLTMLPNALQYDRFDGYSVIYRWNPVVDSAEWYLPGSVSGVIRIPVPSGVNLLKFVNMEAVGNLEVVDGFAFDSVSAQDDVRYMAYRPEAFRTSLLVEGIPAPYRDALFDVAKINPKTEYLIISAPEFMEGALELGRFRSEGSAVTTLSTTVVNAADIYRFYTGGGACPASLRNYIAYAYSVCPDLKYVLLVGSAHYDYRNFTGKSGPVYLPAFEMEDAVTEDFFSALDSGEFVRYGSYDIDVAVGRLPVSTPHEMASYVSKAKDYEMVGRFDHSEWRSTLLMTADDADNGGFVDHTLHTTLQEGVSRAVDSLASEIGYRWNQKKIYLLDYDADAAGQKKGATEDFLNVLNQGALMTTYFGHGSKTDWAAEGLLKPSYIAKLSNRGRYTILNSFSCTVGRFDEGKKRSLSEEFLLADSVGSIVSVGAARETFASNNVELGRNFMLNLLRNNAMLVGDAFVKAKGSASMSYSRQRYNNEHYVLLGEPVIQMPNAGFKISLDQKLDTLKALDKVHLSGSVLGMNDGHLGISMRESRQNKRLFLGLYNIKNDTLDVVYNGSLIYSEVVPVVGGRFETDFVTPKKIAFGDTAVELLAWAYSENEREVGRFLTGGIVASGFSSYADSINDNVPPSIKIQSCYKVGSEASYADGEVVQMQSPACLQVTIEDSTAIDFREQADEGVSIEVEGVEDPHHPYPFMEQSTKKVVFRKNFTTETFPAGTYVFNVRALDVLGNMAKKSITVDITEDMKAGLADVFNIPNPVGKKGTTFYFKNLAVNRTSSVDIFIYNQHGRLVKVLKDAISGVTHWDGKDNFGRPLANGLYHYVVRSEVEASGEFKKKTWTKKQKLLISR